MKLIATLSILLFFFFSTNAQYNKGRNFLGGSFSMTSQKSKVEVSNTESKTSLYSASPYVGTFYRNNRFIGFQGLYSSTKYGEEKPSRRLFGGGVFLRQYFPIGKSGLSFYTEEKFLASFGRDYQRPISIGENVKVKESNFTATFHPAVAYNVTKRLQLELSLPELISIGYSNETPTGANSEYGAKYTSFQASTSLGSGFIGNIAMGASWFF